MHRGSLCGVFGSKHGLFLRVLDAISVPEADSVEREDVVLVALLELAATDPRVREHVGDIIRDNAITTTQLGQRLVARAGLTDDKESV